MFFISGARIDQEAVSSNYWKYFVGSGILATCCGWSAQAALFHRSTYPYLNEEEEIRMDEIRDNHCRDVAEEGEDKKKIDVLRWEIYVKEE